MHLGGCGVEPPSEKYRKKTHTHKTAVAGAEERVKGLAVKSRRGSRRERKHSQPDHARALSLSYTHARTHTSAFVKYFESDAALSEVEPLLSFVLRFFVLVLVLLDLLDLLLEVAVAVAVVVVALFLRNRTSHPPFGPTTIAS